MAKSTATLTDNETGKSFEFPIIHGTIGPRLVDIRKMYGASGMFTYDPGFTSTGSCGSKITYIDGDEGVLLYRGYNIAELAEQSDFMECCYLLMNGELPNKAQKEKFSRDITMHTMVHEQLSQFYRGFRRDAHPMAVCCGVVGALSAFYHDSLDIHDPYQRMVASYRLIAKMPTIAAYSYKHSLGQPFMYPKNALDYCSNFLHMMFANPCEDYAVDPVLAKAIAVRLGIVLLILLILRLPALRQALLSAQSYMADSRAMGVLGVALCALGVGVAIWARAHLGRNWGMPMSQKENPKLVMTGPYAWVRHPIYSGILLAMLGSTIGATVFWILPLVLFGAYFVYSACREEQFMISQFPDQYPAYIKRSHMLLPWPSRADLKPGSET